MLFYENVWISLQDFTDFIFRINNIPALVQIMAWRRPGDKPLSEPMTVYRRMYASLGLNEFIEPFENKLQWNLNRNPCILIQENAFEHDGWKPAVIFFSASMC